MPQRSGNTPGTEPADRAARHFTARETEILNLVADGLTNSQIGDRLYISSHTVAQHLTAMFRRTGARNRAHLVRLAQPQIS
jgi:DNA-binding CsgD family transcriptional regulator